MRKVLSLLGQWDDEDIDWLLATGERVAVPMGMVLIAEGAPSAWVSIILDGTFTVTIAALGGGEVARLEVGEIVGEMSFVEKRPPSATVTAQRDAIVYRIARQRLAEHLADDRAFAARFYRSLAIFLAGRLRQTQNRLGAGAAWAADGAPQAEDALDEMLLDGVGLAGTRFDWMLKRLLGG